MDTKPHVAVAKPGLVRPARRPSGWSPSGPQPAGAQGRADLAPATNEDLCFLSGDFRVFQRQDGHRWSLDDLLTAWVAVQIVGSPPDRYLDLGSGIGSVLMMLAWKFPSARGVGIEAQEISVGLARRSLAFNGIQDRVQLHHADFRKPPKELLGQTFPLITGTPPYFVSASAVESRKPQCAPCRFEWRGGVEAYCEAAAQHLSPGGSFVMVSPASLEARVEAAAAASHLHPSCQLTVIPKLGKAPLIQLHAFSPSAASEPCSKTLVVRDRANQWTAEFAAIRECMGLPGQVP